MSKCTFGEREVEYLGHIWGTYYCFGLTGIFGIDRLLSEICEEVQIDCKPLTTLTKKGKFDWDEDAKLVFEALKRR